MKLKTDVLSSGVKSILFNNVEAERVFSIWVVDCKFIIGF